uniref:Uncharacterized protein n=1 Tax=Arundo donax TaxID=35708 RepID=A0A0A9EE40_ARUDO
MGSEKSLDLFHLEYLLPLDIIGREGQPYVCQNLAYIWYVPFTKCR